MPKNMHPSAIDVIDLKTETEATLTMGAARKPTAQATETAVAINSKVFPETLT